MRISKLSVADSNYASIRMLNYAKLSQSFDKGLQKVNVLNVDRH